MVWLAEFQRDPSRTFESRFGARTPFVALFQDATVIHAVQHRPVEARLDDPLINAVDLEQLHDWGEQGRDGWSAYSRSPRLAAAALQR